MGSSELCRGLRWEQTQNTVAPRSAAEQQMQPRSLHVLQGGKRGESVELSCDKLGGADGHAEHTEALLGGSQGRRSDKHRILANSKFGDSSKLPAGAPHLAKVLRLPRKPCLSEICEGAARAAKSAPRNLYQTLRKCCSCQAMA